ncbi:MAG: hypoxanthine phosphoribosyltransferase [Alphaproteobacteria bacterium]|nr:hypoxanthine phosphoribosyltransferase [Alphaproteobacteria bacterium]
MAEKRSIPVLYTAAEIKDRVEALAAEIAANISGDFLIVSLLRGSFMFTADLVRELCAIGIHPQIDFMTLQSYGAGTQSSGEVKVGRDLTEDVKGKTILVVDDILETGRTLSYALDLLKSRGAESIKVAMLLEKPGKLEVAAKADFVGFSIPDKFVVGYGLDYANHYRELPFIGYLDVH